MEQKHTPGPKEMIEVIKTLVHRSLQWEDGEIKGFDETMIESLAPMLLNPFFAPLLQQVAELTKENEDLTAWQTTATNVLKISGEIKVKLETEIKALTEQVEKLKANKTDLETSVKNLVEMYEEKVEQRKELVEALRARYEHLKWLKDVNTTPPSVIDEINFLQSLLSKFEVPNQS